ncbi:5'-nucleotidase domain-containing protein 3 [Phytophthora boehmeriae]|uniref:5'-nucleotidase domain-containing protein 3 n=1 Tax=Phytophthora boehmeriae TaxID=109152 RepID=A0A8T1VQ65_9STRA|nr:5'-nucleotidase domain-containing protein 3 [Phytophthora boehmeriae]
MALLRASKALLASSRCGVSSRRLSALSFVPELRAAIPQTLPAIHNLVADYERDLQTFQPSSYIPPDVVFANNHLKLSAIDVVGFDYDYTLCHYTEELQHLIYAMARDYMVSNLRYPEGVSVLQYDPSFAIRGLTIDKQKGLLCKISSHQKLSTAAVFRGRQRLSRDEIMELYGGSRHISVRDRDYNMEPLNDLFSVAHACLFADVVQYMMDRDIEYEPIALVEDVHQAIANVHLSGEMHREVAQDPPKYIEPNPTLRPLLERIRSSGKKSFLCTNSSFPYINAGLRHMLGDEWRELFDVVSVSANKPKFYTRKRSFRHLDTENKQVQWHAVRALDRGQVYTQGSVYQLAKLTGWVGNRVLYIGDSIFSDLVEPSRANGWRTGAIIRELEDEMRVHRTPEYQRLAFQIHKVEELMRNIQNQLRSEPIPQNHGFVDQLVDVHEELQMAMENLVNANFGSVFRADAYPSQFAFFVQRYVDIYSARLENLLEYPSNHTFYPERIGMPHEEPVGVPRYE